MQTLESDGTPPRMSAGVLERKLTDLESCPAVILLLTNPVNPTGVVYDKKNIDSLANVLAKFPNVLTICDEIFVDTELGDRRVHSIAACESIAARVLTLNGVSKSRGYPEVNKTGIRFSFAVSVDASLLKLVRMCLESNLGVDRLSACFGILAYSDCESVRDYLNAARDIQNRRIDELRDELRALPVELWLDPPESTSLVMLDFQAMSNPEVGLSTSTAIALLLQKYGLKLVPGELFGIDAHLMVIRLSLGVCTSRDKWNRASDI